MRFLLPMQNTLRILCLLLTFSILFSCKKKDDDSVLGLDVQPANDLLGITVADSTSIFMHTQRVDSVRTFNDQYKYLGSVIDPFFGRTDASIYTNFFISNNLTNVSFGANPVLDSAVMLIRYLGQFAGDTATKLDYQVYLLNQNITPSTAYYTSQHFQRSTNPVNIGTARIKSINNIPYLAIPIDYNLGQYILQTTSNLTNNTVFQAAYKGFYITTSNTSTLSSVNKGSIKRFDLDDDLSGLMLYYRDGSSVNTKGKSFQFTFRNSEALRFNHIDHNYGAGAVPNLYDQITGAGTADTLKGDVNVYLNSFGGTRTRVYLPFLKSFSDSQHVSISRAELIIKVDEPNGYSSNFPYPSKLALLASSSNGTEELVWDMLETSDFVKYSGEYDATNKQYVFNIARQMQKIITHKIENYGFYLVNADPARAIVARRDNRLERVVIGGKNSLNYKPVFKVTYIKFPFDK